MTQITYLFAIAIYEAIFGLLIGGPAFLVWMLARGHGAPPALSWSLGAFAVLAFLGSAKLARFAAFCLAYQNELFFQAGMSAVRSARNDLASLPLIGSLFAPPSAAPSEDE